ncbi:MAG TPA: outer membrane beta-barrel protein [Vicinamibacterales bacterium]|nr:outer membrane beta-barrel protein [Vicinamibacterales bacterium]
MKLRLNYAGRTALLLLFLGGVATPASADWLLTPYLGVTFGGSADFGNVGDLDDNFERKVAYGVNAAWMGAGAVGFELDFGTTPNFFQDTFGSGDFDWGDSNVTTLMANLVVGAPIGGQTGVGFRPYGSAGIGLLRSHVSSRFFDDLSVNELGFNLGAGAHAFFNDNLGLRGDVRYFRGLAGDDGDDAFLELKARDINFWRGTLGVTFRF